MTQVSMDRGTANFIVREAAGEYRSREEVTVDATGGAMVAGTILGKVTASGKYVRHAAGASDGSEAEAGILFEGIEAVEESRAVVVRAAEVNAAHLVYEVGADAAQITASNTALAALGIIVR